MLFVCYVINADTNIDYNCRQQILKLINNCFCVERMYDRNDQNFFVSYFKHNYCNDKVIDKNIYENIYIVRLLATCRTI
jgi:hypothetical protein